VLHPIVNKLAEKNVPKPISILIIYSLFLIFFIWILLKGTPYIIKEGQELIEHMPQMAETYGSFVNTIHEQAEVLPSTFQD
ncbi:AI-2E family transporter, partial [Pseudomonas sp. 2822-15]|uniref:AI-2E family transporter n=1 Tax=Pseudomonas sp. 2822-15 TaxID=1712677 RepID=UPI001179B504